MRKYVIPFLLSFLGVYLAATQIIEMTGAIPRTNMFESMAIGFGIDMTLIMIITMPILALLYYLFAIPGAYLILFGAKVVKSHSYEMNIMNMGRRFGSVQLIRRAAAPALFSVASAEILRSAIENFLFGFDPTIPEEFLPLYPVTLSLMSSLLFLPVALLLFMPTWVLNDAGIITHLKSDRLKIRQTPDTQGVGRWIANMLGGYSLVAFPITMFMNHFYGPFILPFLLGSTLPENIAIQVVVSILWTVGLPFFVMAFIMPIILLNEAMQNRVRTKIGKFAKKLGAKPVRKVKIREDRRTKRIRKGQKEDGEIEDEEEPNVILTTAKTIQASKTKGSTKSRTTKKTTEKKSTRKKQ